MGKFTERQKEKEEGREKDKVRREKLAGFFFDSAKIIFAGMVVGGLTPLYSDEEKSLNSYMIGVGIIATILLAWIGNKILK